MLPVAVRLLLCRMSTPFPLLCWIVFSETVTGEPLVTNTPSAPEASTWFFRRIIGTVEFPATEMAAVPLRVTELCSTFT
jgi:hypothetical protein